MVVKEVSKNGQDTMDLTTYAFQKKREIYLTGTIDDDTAMEILRQLRYLDGLSDEPIRMIINSPGGSVSAGMAIMDAMNLCKSEVYTIATGEAASMGAFLLSCGAKGHRYATATAEIMIHQPLGGVQGQAVEIELAAKHIQATKHVLYNTLSANTGQTYARIEKDSDRDCFFSAEEAVQYGLIDKILTSFAVLDR